MTATLNGSSPQLERVLAALGPDRLRGQTGHDHTARCPAHEDQRASLTVADGERCVILRCHAGCEPRAIVEALGLTWADLFPPKHGKGSGRIVATYPYQDAQGALLFEVVRFDPKDFRQRRPDPAGRDGWTWSLKGVRRVLYRLPAVLREARAGGRVFVVEGEKDVAALERLGVVATCNAGGAGKWTRDYTESLRGAGRVVVVPDKDEPGRKHAGQVAAAVARVVGDVRVLELPGLGKDAADWVGAGGTREQLEDLVRAAPLLAHPPAPGQLRRATRAPELPEIEVGPNLRAMVDQAEEVLARSGRDLFHRRGELVRLAGDAGRPSIVALPQASLMEVLSDVARWVKVRETKDGPVRVSVPPPRDAVEAFAARGAWPHLRELVAVTDAPTLRPDGSVLQVAGYDRAARVLYTPSCAYPAVPERPTRDQATEALEALWEPFSEFPIVDSCDRAAILAAVLSLLARGAIAGPVPMFAVRATTPASGKSLVVDAAAAIATGADAPRMAQGERRNSSEEEAKRLLALGREGAQLALIDNCERPLGSDVLAAAITGRRFRGRVLGSSSTAEVDVPVFFATGNNLQVAGDLGRRVLPIDLDPQCENPEERTFARSNLIGWVRAHRAELVVAGLTVMRAFYVAGCPQAEGLAPFGSFEAWSATVRAALVWLGEDDPCGGRVRIREEDDPQRDANARALEVWADELGVEAVTVRELVRRAGAREALAEALAELDQDLHRDKLDVEVLARVFRSLRGRILDGRRLVLVGRRTREGRRYRVEELRRGEA